MLIRGPFCNADIDQKRGVYEHMACFNYREQFNQNLRIRRETWASGDLEQAHPSVKTLASIKLQ